MQLALVTAALLAAMLLVWTAAVRARLLTASQFVWPNAVPSAALGIALTPLFAYVLVANVYIYLNLRYEFFDHLREPAR